MPKQILLLVLAVVLAVVTAAFFFGKEKPAAEPAYIAPGDAAVLARGKEIYAAHCASCHGAQLEGQADWRQRLPNGRLPAPPHDVSGHTWHHPDEVLIDIVKNGLVPGKTAPQGYESDMPAYAGILSDADITAVLAYIKSSWPPEALAIQKELTLRRAE